MNKSNKKSIFHRKTVANKDFTESMLPHNRKEVFFDVLKLNWSRFLLYAFIFLIFSLPLIYFKLDEITKLAEFQEVIKVATEEEKIELLNVLYAYNNSMTLRKSCCLLLLVIPFAGLIKVFRQHAWEENVFLSADIGSSFKDNTKQMLILGFLVSFVYFFANVNLNSIGRFNDNTIMLIISISTIPVFILFGVPIVSYSIVTLSIYNNSFIQMIKLSIALILKHPFKTLLALICALSFIIIHSILNLFFVNAIFEIVLSFIDVLTLPICLFAWFLFTLNQLDELVNKDQFPHLVGKGTVSE